MPDDLRIPAPAGRAPYSQTYRAQRPGLDQGTKRLLMAAAGLGALLLAGTGTWALLNRHPVVVPVIEADKRPLRVKPENPGGMTVAGADEQGGADGMAPAAEAPAPQALRAQMQPAPAAPVPAALPPTASPLPDTPSRAATAARSTSSVRPSAVPAAGGTLVQLAAVDTEAAAQAEWQRLAKRMPDVLGDRRAVVQRAERDGHAVWRVRTGGFADIADATGFCARVRAKGGACAIASF